MTVVRFATTCDHPVCCGEYARCLTACVERDPDAKGRPCGRRSEEYTAWPVCSECDRDTCPDHMADGTLDPGDGDREDRCLCRGCDARIKALILEQRSPAPSAD